MGSNYSAAPGNIVGASSINSANFLYNDNQLKINRNNHDEISGNSSSNSKALNLGGTNNNLKEDSGINIANQTGGNSHRGNGISN